LANPLKAVFARRWLTNLVAALCCFGLFGFALFSQFKWGLQPCPLCIFQRIAVVALGVAFLLAAAVPQRVRALSVIAAVLIGAAALAGAVISARHLYIQSLPPGSVPACGATLNYMWEVFPAMDVLKKVLTGSGECAKVDWRFLGLAMPGWVLIWMVGLGVTGVAVNLRRRRQGF
jgi:protein dithiol:quinone oxidoreductase